MGIQVLLFPVPLYLQSSHSLVSLSIVIPKGIFTHHTVNLGLETNKYLDTKPYKVTYLYQRRNKFYCDNVHGNCSQEQTIWVRISGLYLASQWEKLFKTSYQNRLLSKYSLMRNFHLSSSPCTCLLFVQGQCLPAASLELLIFLVELCSSEGLACDLSDSFKCLGFVL